ncbi:MAG: M48 family metalloprotease [Thermodesulfobacteriota bacterium]
MKSRLFFWAAMVLVIPVILAGCTEVVKVGTSVGQEMGAISKEDKEKIDRMALETEKAARPMTEQEEYYLGRAVAATILGKYRVYSNENSARYINEVGQAVALASDRPFTYGGYHFVILDTDEVNALSCPGGIIFITRGMLKKAQNEEELAAILAHEVGHVNHKDGVGAIQRARWVEVVTLLGSEAAKKVSGADLAKLLSLFEGSVNDVVKTLLVSGYSRDQEAAADLSALTFLYRLGYDPQGLTDFMEELAKEQTGGAGQGLFATHPGMTERLAKARSVIAENKWLQTVHPARDRRFQQATG